LFAEATFAYTILGEPYKKYLESTNEYGRIFDRLWFLLYKQKEAYWNTPPEKRPYFLDTELGSEARQLSLDQLINQSIEKQRLINQENEQMNKNGQSNGVLSC